MRPKAYRIKDHVLIHYKYDAIEMYDPINIIELGEELIKIGEKMIEEQSHI